MSSDPQLHDWESERCVLREEIRTNFAIFEVLCEASSNRMRLIDARYREQNGQSPTNTVYDQLDEPPRARVGGDGQAAQQRGQGEDAQGYGEAEAGAEMLRTTSI